MFELKTLTDYSEDSLLAEIRHVVSVFDGARLTREKFDNISRVHSSTLSRRFGSWNNALDKAGISESIAPRVRRLSRAAVLEEIQAYAREFDGQSPSMAAIAERLETHSSTLIRSFGRWVDLLDAVGLQPVPLGRRYSDEECFENIVLLWTHYGRQPTFAELSCPPSNVGSKAYVRRWGGWRAAIDAFIHYVEQAKPPSQIEADTSIRDSRGGSASSNKEFDRLPRSPGLALRYKVLLRDRFRCLICGRSPARDLGVELHVDHIIPWSRGGESTEENLRALCFDCNLGKGAAIEVVQPA